MSDLKRKGRRHQEGEKRKDWMKKKLGGGCYLLASGIFLPGSKLLYQLFDSIFFKAIIKAQWVCLDRSRIKNADVKFVSI